MLVASSAVLAEQSLVEGIAKQAVQDKATEVAPDAVKNVEATNQALDKAKSLKGANELAPDALQDQAKEVVKKKASAAVLLRPTVFKVIDPALFEVRQLKMTRAIIGRTHTEDSARQNAGC